MKHKLNRENLSLFKLIIVYSGSVSNTIVPCVRFNLIAVRIFGNTQIIKTFYSLYSYRIQAVFSSSKSHILIISCITCTEKIFFSKDITVCVIL